VKTEREILEALIDLLEFSKAKWEKADGELRGILIGLKVALKWVLDVKDPETPVNAVDHILGMWRKEKKS
jgi:hypothetical protein